MGIYGKLLLEKLNIDTGEGNKLQPVFIVCLLTDSGFKKVATKILKEDKYWHVSVGFGPSLSTLYSFNYNNSKEKADDMEANESKGGITRESLEHYMKYDPECTIQVNCVFIEKDKYEALKKVLNYYLENKDKTRYSMINLINCLTTKFKLKDNNQKLHMICSQFVDTILKAADVNITDKNSNIVRPNDLTNNKKDEKQFLIYEGRCDGYKVSNVINKLEKLSNNIKNSYHNSKLTKSEEDKKENE